MGLISLLGCWPSSRSPPAPEPRQQGQNQGHGEPSVGVSLPCLHLLGDGVSSVAGLASLVHSVGESAGYHADVPRIVCKLTAPGPSSATTGLLLSLSNHRKGAAVQASRFASAGLRQPWLRVEPVSANAPARNAWGTSDLGFLTNHLAALARADEEFTNTLIDVALSVSAPLGFPATSAPTRKLYNSSSRQFIPGAAGLMVASSYIRNPEDGTLSPALVLELQNVDLRQIAPAAVSYSQLATMRERPAPISFSAGVAPSVPSQGTLGATPADNDVIADRSCIVRVPSSAMPSMRDMQHKRNLLRASAMIAAVPCIATLLELTSDLLDSSSAGMALAPKRSTQPPPGRVLLQNELSVAYWGNMTVSEDKGALDLLSMLFGKEPQAIQSMMEHFQEVRKQEGALDRLGPWKKVVQVPRACQLGRIETRKRRRGRQRQQAAAAEIGPESKSSGMSPTPSNASSAQHESSAPLGLQTATTQELSSSQAAIQSMDVPRASGATDAWARFSRTGSEDHQRQRYAGMSVHPSNRVLSMLSRLDHNEDFSKAQPKGGLQVLPRSHSTTNRLPTLRPLPAGPRSQKVDGIKTRASMSMSMSTNLAIIQPESPGVDAAFARDSHPVYLNGNHTPPGSPPTIIRQELTPPSSPPRDPAELPVKDASGKLPPPPPPPFNTRIGEIRLEETIQSSLSRRRSAPIQLIEEEQPFQTAEANAEQPLRESPAEGGRRSPLLPGSSAAPAGSAGSKPTACGTPEANGEQPARPSPAEAGQQEWRREAVNHVDLGQGLPTGQQPQEEEGHASDSGSDGYEEEVASEEGDELEKGLKWHEVQALTVCDPVTGKEAILLLQTDITARAMMEKRMSTLTETQLTMLENMYPRQVLEFAMSGTGPTMNLGSLAYEHEEVTVLFMDIVGFTSMSKEVQPQQVMQFLNSMFSKLDDLCDFYDVYKVDTAGDCYIVAGALMKIDQDGFIAFDEDADVHEGARNVVDFAQAIMRLARIVRMPHNGLPATVRVGIHTGSVVSGLVGTKLLKFSLFGDTMNTSSRMESTSRPGCIQISSSTYEILDDEQRALFIPTGGVEVKGKGLMATYIYEPREEDLALRPEDLGPIQEESEAPSSPWQSRGPLFVVPTPDGAWPLLPLASSAAQSTSCVVVEDGQEGMPRNSGMHSLEPEGAAPSQSDDESGEAPVARRMVRHMSTNSTAVALNHISSTESRGGPAGSWLAGEESAAAGGVRRQTVEGTEAGREPLQPPEMVRPEQTWARRARRNSASDYPMTLDGLHDVRASAATAVSSSNAGPYRPCNDLFKAAAAVVSDKHEIQQDSALNKLRKLRATPTASTAAPQACRLSGPGRPSPPPPGSARPPRPQ